MRSAFGVEHGEFSKADGPIDLSAFRNAKEDKRKQGIKRFLDNHELVRQFDKPLPHKSFSDEITGGFRVNYRRPDGSVTGPRPRAVPDPVPTPKKASKVGTAALGAAAVGVGGYAVHQNRKATAPARRLKKR